MISCTVCRKGSLRLLHEKTEMMPPPIGTNLPPLPLKVCEYQCNNCNSKYEQKNEGPLILRSRTPGLQDEIWEYLDSNFHYVSGWTDVSRSNSLRERLIAIGEPVILPFLEVSVHFYKLYGRSYKDLMKSRSSKINNTIDSDFGELVYRLVAAGVEWLQSMNETAYLQLSSYLASKNSDIRR